MLLRSRLGQLGAPKLAPFGPTPEKEPLTMLSGPDRVDLDPSRQRASITIHNAVTLVAMTPSFAKDLPLAVVYLGKHQLAIP